jgi:hypothetical protein
MSYFLQIINYYKYLDVTNYKFKEQICYLKNLNDLFATNAKLRGFMKCILHILYYVILRFFFFCRLNKV